MYPYLSNISYEICKITKVCVWDRLQQSLHKPFLNVRDKRVPRQPKSRIQLGEHSALGLNTASSTAPPRWH